MKLDRTAFVARTAHDKDHVNRLVVPEYGVVAIRIRKGDTKMSKYYLPAKSVSPREDPKKDEGQEEFCFAPGPQFDETSWAPDTNKHDKVKVWYHLYNPFSVIKEAKLELFRRWEEPAMWTRELKDDELIDGEHELEFEKGEGSAKTKSKEWDGEVTKDTEKFPDGFITTEHSPYKLRLTVKGDGVTNSPSAWTIFHVFIEKMKLEWGEKECIPAELDPAKPDPRKPFETLKTACSDPKDADDTTGRIYLLSHIFKAGGSMFDNSLHDLYKTMWGEGPQIPIYVKLWVRNSEGNPVVAPAAFGKTKFLWDWESKLDAGASAFANDAQDFHKGTTKPNGQNCHKDRGGKREDEAKVVFPAQAGYEANDTLKEGEFPFKVEINDDKRKWASYSQAWSKGKLGGQTGVLFRPSRMAGDKYRLYVYAAHEITDDQRKPRLNIDKQDFPLPIDDKLKLQSGTFQVWRKLYFRRRMTKSGSDTVGVGGTSAFYVPAFIDIEDKSGSVVPYPASEWNSAFTSIYTGWSSFDKYFVDSGVNQHTAGAHGIHFRTHVEFKTLLTSSFPAPTGGWDPWYVSNNVDTAAKYAGKCQDLAIAALQQIFDAKMPADDGISLFHTAYSMNLSVLAGLGSFTDGLAHDFTSGSVSKSAFLWLAPPAQYSGGGAGVDATPAHEIGHHLMLPHPKNTAENTGSSATNDYSAHDAGVSNCLMSYLSGARVLCGFCLLRLRGWDKSVLSTTSATNKKP